mmetsp:Transcript_8670/g.13774  ORF Transcript_8670/g.13774 Transcript_8670/m.13774 type:complete len:206 (-) Transcript_8670:940-1557(-)
MASWKQGRALARHGRTPCYARVTLRKLGNSALLAGSTTHWAFDPAFGQGLFPGLIYYFGQGLFPGACFSLPRSRCPAWRPRILVLVLAEAWRFVHQRKHIHTADHRGLEPPNAEPHTGSFDLEAEAAGALIALDHASQANVNVHVLGLLGALDVVAFRKAHLLPVTEVQPHLLFAPCGQPSAVRVIGDQGTAHGGPAHWLRPGLL